MNTQPDNSTSSPLVTQAEVKAYFEQTKDLHTAATWEQVLGDREMYLCMANTLEAKKKAEAGSKMVDEILAGIEPQAVEQPGYNVCFLTEENFKKVFYRIQTARHIVGQPCLGPKAQAEAHEILTYVANTLARISKPRKRTNKKSQ